MCLGSRRKPGKPTQIQGKHPDLKHMDLWGGCATMPRASIQCFIYAECSVLSVILDEIKGKKTFSIDAAASCMCCDKWKDWFGSCRAAREKNMQVSLWLKTYLLTAIQHGLNFRSSMTSAGGVKSNIGRRAYEGQRDTKFSYDAVPLMCNWCVRHRFESQLVLLLVLIRERDKVKDTMTNLYGFTDSWYLI